MKTIWKFPLEIANHQIIESPSKAQFLSIEAQKGVPVVYCLVDTQNPREDIHIYLFGTGEPIDHVKSPLDYLGTVTLENGSVWHIFQSDIKNKKELFKTWG
ncbi:MAG: hypothetical protein PHD09_03940 [Candidatus Omnitrophica bacterium]|nr:hypothetical protein [Candidatus Omnitrophota bacterium]